MVLPFELYCRECGCRLIAAAEAEALPLIQGEASVESWISQRIRGRTTKCPNCGRVITTDVLVRADVIFKEWDDNMSEKEKLITYYV